MGMWEMVFPEANFVKSKILGMSSSCRCTDHLDTSGGKEGKGKCFSKFHISSLPMEYLL